MTLASPWLLLSLIFYCVLLSVSCIFLYFCVLSFGQGAWTQSGLVTNQRYETDGGILHCFPCISVSYSNSAQLWKLDIFQKLMLSAVYIISKYCTLHVTLDVKLPSLVHLALYRCLVLVWDWPSAGKHGIIHCTLLISVLHYEISVRLTVVVVDQFCWRAIAALSSPSLPSSPIPDVQ